MVNFYGKIRTFLYNSREIENEAPSEDGDNSSASNLTTPDDDKNDDAESSNKVGFEDSPTNGG